MYNVQVLRTAALELQAVDDNDIVKVAGVFRRIKNWWKAFRDPKYRKRVEGLQNESVRIKHLIEGLGEQIDQLQAAIKDTDVPLYERSLNQVRQLSLELSRDLYGFRQDMNAAISTAPSEVTEVPEHRLEPSAEPSAELSAEPSAEPEVSPKVEEEDVGEPRARWHYTADEMKNPEVREQMKQQLPADHDVPIGAVNKPMQDFNWFSQVSPENVYLSDSFINHYQGELADSLARKISVYGDEEQDKAFYHALVLTPEIETQIRERLPSAILNGNLKRYTFQKPSEQVQNRPANQMLAVVHTDEFEVVLPASEVFQGAKPIKTNAVVFLNDMRASYIGSPLLMGAGSKYVRVVSHDPPISGQEVIEQQTPEQITEQPEQETPQQETPIQTGTVVYPSGNYWISDIPGDRKRKFQTMENALQFAGDKVGVENVNVLADDPEEKKAQVRSLELLRFANRESRIEKTAADHKWARNVLIQAFREEMGREPTLAELQGAQAVAYFETKYGKAWKGEGSGSNNWGAIQVRSSPTKTVKSRDELADISCGSNAFRHVDSRPQDDGSSIYYVVCFHKYSTPVEGAKALIRELYKQTWRDRGENLQLAAQKGSLPAFSAAMYDSNYYQGFGKTREERIAGHVKAMNNALNNITVALNESKAMSDEQPTESVQEQPSQKIAPGIEQEYQNIMRELFATGPLEKIVRKAIERKVLPTTKVLLAIHSNSSFPVQVKYARILCSALRAELGAESAIHTNGKTIEIESDVVGSEQAVEKAVAAIADGVSDAFELSTKRAGKSCRIIANAFINCDSQYNILDLKTSEECLRKFAFEMMS